MKRKIGLVVSIFVTLFLLGTICMAQDIPGYQSPMVPEGQPPVPTGLSPIGPGYPPHPAAICQTGYHFDPNAGTCVPDSQPTQVCQAGYHFDSNAGTCVPDSQPTQVCQAGYHFDSNAGTCVPDSQAPQVGHPATGPSYTLPNVKPDASTSGELTNLNAFGGQTLSKEQVETASNSTIGSSCKPGLLCYIPPTLGVQYWVWYNWQWTTGPAAEFRFKRMNTLIYNDQSQYLYGYEMDPNGLVTWRNWGYRWPGYLPNWFRGDVPGWYTEAIWGSQSNWSNILYIYVW